MDYSFHKALESDAFLQLPLVNQDKLQREASKRGIKLSLGHRLVEQLEELDEIGAFRPIAFSHPDRDDIVVRERIKFRAWKDYEIRSGRGAAHYSPWQLLYLSEALELGTTKVPTAWYLHGENQPSPSAQFVEWLEIQTSERSRLDDRWRDVTLLLVRLQNRHFPSVRGSMTKATVNLTYDHSTHDFVDPFVKLRAEWDPEAVVGELRITANDLRKQQETLAIKGENADPAKRLYMMLRMAPYRVRERFEGALRRAHDFYDAADILRRFFHELTGELLPDADEIFDGTGGEWKKRLFGHEPRLGFTPKDLTVELKRQGLYPHAVHLSVEGETEAEVFRELLETFSGRSIDEIGIEISLLGGVGKTRLHSRLVRAARVYAQFPIVVTDREGDVERDLRILVNDGILPEDNLYLWETSFEEANFSDHELVQMAQDIAAERSARLTLEPALLRLRYDADRARRGKYARGLGEVLLDLAAHPDHGSVRISKVELAKEMSKTVVDAAHAGEEEALLLERRPVLRIVFDILRVT